MNNPTEIIGIITKALVRLSVAFLGISAGLWLLNGIWYYG